jgi:predicted nucleic acid-binding protein
MIMLDSTACIDFLNGNEKVKVKMNTFKSLYCTTTISVYEVSIGLERTKRMKSHARYKELSENWLRLLSSLQVFALDIKAAEKAAEINDELEAKGKRVDDNDNLIMGIMKLHGMNEIVTRNPDHFKNVSDIIVHEYA